MGPISSVLLISDVLMVVLLLFKPRMIRLISVRVSIDFLLMVVNRSGALEMRKRRSNDVSILVSSSSDVRRVCCTRPVIRLPFRLTVLLWCLWSKHRWTPDCVCGACMKLS